MKMKKVTAILAIVCICVSGIKVSAQDIKFGVKGSLLTSTVNAKESGVYNLRSGFEIGAYGQYNLTDELGVSFEPAFAMKGANKIDPLIVYSAESALLWDEINQVEYGFLQHDLSLSVIELPVLVQLNLDMGMGLHIFAGPSFDFILKAEHFYEREDEDRPEDFYRDYGNEADITDRFAYYDFGVVVGTGIEIEADPLDIRVQIKYRYGVSDINVVENKPVINQHNLGVTLGIGFNKLFF